MIFIKPWSSVVCPFCFKRFHVGSCHFRCANQNKTECPWEEDKELSRHRSKMSPTPIKLQNRHVIYPSQKLLHRLWGRFVMPQRRVCRCSYPTNSRLCPHCHEELPVVTGVVEDRIIAIVGARGTGKSHYIATIVHQLRNEVGDRFDCTVQALNEETLERYNRRFHRPLYEAAEKKALEATVGIESPMVFRLDLLSMKSSRRRKRSIALSFYDVSGELFDQRVKMGAAEYLHNAAGIIFLIDPLQIGSVRDRLQGKGVQLPLQATDPVDILDRFVIEYEARGGLGSSIKVPIAIALTKCDAIRSIEADDSPVWGLGCHDNGVLDVGLCDQIHSYVRSLLADFVANDEFNRKVTDRFSTHRYFALSALGQSPDAQRRIQNVRSWRVEDPLLWLLFRLGVLPGRSGSR